MSTTEDSVGLGWEVWFLFAVLAAAGVGGLLVASLIGGGVVPVIGESAATGSSIAPIDPARAAVGAVVAALAVAATVWIVRTTDWRPEDGPPTDP